jgi:hypothetical protein
MLNRKENKVDYITQIFIIKYDKQIFIYQSVFLFDEQLFILVPPRFLSYFPLEASIPYLEGSSMNLSCRAFAIPPANITWIYRDKNKQSKSKLFILILLKNFFFFLLLSNS